MSGRKGFALVVTLVLMILLTVIAVGLLGLASITLRTSGVDKDVAVARANARLGMMMALGELQKQLGPDQAISAPAESLTPAVPSLNAGWKHATAVLKRTRTANFNPAETPKDKISREFSAWLVSGDPTVTSGVSSAAAAMPGSLLTLVRKNGSTSPDEVRAGAVNVSTGSKNPSRYAWWIEDVGTKASLGLPQQADETLRALAPDRMDARKIAGLESAPALNSPLWGKVVSIGTTELVTGVADKSRGGARSVTALHRGVLADTTSGRLKRDLTVALGESKSTMESLLGGNQVYGPVATAAGATDPGGPHWEQLRQYYQSGGESTLTVRRQTKDQIGYYPVIAGVTEMYGISNTTGFAPATASFPAFGPAYYNSYSNKNNYCMTFHMSPVIKLWNPYDRPLNAPNGFTVAVANGNAQSSSGDESYQDVILWGNYFAKTRPPKTCRYEHRYFIPAHTLQPGETRVFALGANRFLDLDGTYVPAQVPGQPALDVGAKTVVSKSDGSGWILGDLSDITTSGFQGYSFWDLMLTKIDSNKDQRHKLNWKGGRAIGGTGSPSPDGGDIQVLDSASPGGRYFQVVPHPFTSWNVRLYDGRQERPPIGQPDAKAPLVNIRNINTDTTGFNRPAQSPFYVNPDPRTYPLFVSQGKNELWARRFVLKQADNDGDSSSTLYNAAASRTKDCKWLANFNPRSPTFGCWPKEANRTPGSLPVTNPQIATSDFTGISAVLRVNGSRNGAGGGNNGLGTPGNLLTGLVATLASVDPFSLYLNPAIGYSDKQGDPEKCILFQSPGSVAAEKYFFSLGQLTHANLWIENGSYDADVNIRHHGTEDWFADNLHPAYPIGNSYADPRLLLTVNEGRYQSLSVLEDGTTYESTFHDLSYYMNRSLWDGYFLSARKTAAGEVGSWNSRLADLTGRALVGGKSGFAGNSANLLVNGAFNINSTDPQAWAAFLGSMCDVNVGGSSVKDATYARVIPNTGGQVSKATSESSQSQYSGFRALAAAEITDLSSRIVEQIKLRGPATSLADFVNRSVSSGAPVDQQVKGALQAAIDATSINGKFSGHGIPDSKVDRLYEKTAFSGDIGAGAPGYLTQADLLTRLGGTLAARSDTFVIRSRGEALDAAGLVIVSAILETTVQRLPEYIDPGTDATIAFDDLPAASVARTFGRSFRIVSSRWIPTNEI